MCLDRFEVPDRVSAVQSLGDLNPQRKWNLVLVSEKLTTCFIYQITICAHCCIHYLLQVNVTLHEVNAMRLG